MLNATLCPEAESKTVALIVDQISSLDSEIKIRPRKGTRLVPITTNSNLTDKKVILNNIQQKIESKEQYSMNMERRNQDEKEIKAELMLCLFMKYVDEKIQTMNKKGKAHIEKFSVFFMKLCCDKILDVSISNFI